MFELLASVHDLQQKISWTRDAQSSGCMATASNWNCVIEPSQGTSLPRGGPRFHTSACSVCLGAFCSGSLLCACYWVLGCTQLLLASARSGNVSASLFRCCPPCPSVPLSLCSFVSLFLSLSVLVAPYLSVSLSVSLFVFLSVSLSVSLSLFVSLSLCLSLWLCLWLCLWLFLCFSVYLPPFLSLSFSLSLSLCLCCQLEPAWDDLTGILQATTVPTKVTTGKIR